ncbi:MAG: hypothetical protein WA975_05005 [Mesorhizobium sp.]
MIESEGRQANWRRQNLHKYQAHLAVEAALRRGDLAKGPCEVCGTTEGRIDAHHDDYSEPLAVRWLCRLHHNRLHAGGNDLFRKDAA